MVSEVSLTVHDRVRKSNNSTMYTRCISTVLQRLCGLFIQKRQNGRIKYVVIDQLVTKNKSSYTYVYPPGKVNHDKHS